MPAAVVRRRAENGQTTRVYPDPRLYDRRRDEMSHEVERIAT